VWTVCCYRTVAYQQEQAVGDYYVSTIPNYYDGDRALHIADTLAYETRNQYNWKWASQGPSYTNQSTTPFVNYSADFGKYSANQQYYTYLGTYVQQCNNYYPSATVAPTTAPPTTYY